VSRKAKLTLAALALVCVLPVAASYLSFYFWPPEGQVNYGELIEPAAMDGAGLQAVDGLPFDRESLEGRWVLVYSGPASCDDSCRTALYYTRQIRTAMGKEMDRVKRLWLVTDGGTPDPAVMTGQNGLEVAHIVPRWLEQLKPAAAPDGRVYLVDPLGLVMMRYPHELDARRVIKDVERLLKYSRVG
jgi:cytochrome oxidase Cu insertion factor (SCO1/SenC/PrrC family)